MLALAGVAILAGVMCAILIDVTMTRFLLGSWELSLASLWPFSRGNFPARVHEFGNVRLELEANPG